MAAQHSSLGQRQVNCTGPHLLPADPLQRSPVGHPECALAPQARSCSPEPRQQPVRGLQRLCRICQRPPLQPAGYTWRNVWFLLGVVVPLVMQHHAPKVCSTNVRSCHVAHGHCLGRAWQQQKQHGTQSHESFKSAGHATCADAELHTWLSSEFFAEQSCKV